MKKLIFTLTKKDFEITWFSGSGAGGQHRNKHQNCCRIKHIATGILSTGQSQRDRQSNVREAFDGIKRNKLFLSWCSLRCYEIEQGKSIEQIVDEWMTSDNLRVECMLDGEWKEESTDATK